VTGLDQSGPAAPPRVNGELLFEAPWEARVFGLTMALIEAGAFEHDEFRAELIAEIGSWEAGHEAGGTYRYYERWLAALATLLAAKELCAADLLAARERELAARPAGHDHPHRHDSGGHGAP
jgi:nitrile hydratase accessory protein